MSPEDREATEHAFDEELQTVEPPQEHLMIEDMREIKLKISADLGQCNVTVRDVLELKQGSVLALNTMAGEMADIYVNNVPFGKGEVVVLVDSLHVRVAEIIGVTDRDSGHA